MVDCGLIYSLVKEYRFELSWCLQTQLKSYSTQYVVLWKFLNCLDILRELSRKIEDMTHCLNELTVDNCDYEF